MVLSILSDATRPCFTRRELRCSMLILGHPLFGKNGLNLRVRAAHRFDLRKIGQMPGTQREAQVEQLRLGFARLLAEFVDRQAAQLVQLALFHAEASSRETIFVPIGSFAAARRSA